MKQSLKPDCSRFLVFDFNTSQALFCVLSVMYSCNFSLFHRDNILNPIQARLFYPLKVQGGGSLRTPLMISGTIKASLMKLCTVIRLLKPCQNTERNFSKSDL